jgi:hypothetical protein
MRKWAVLVIVLLLAAAAALQYGQRREELKKAAELPGQPQHLLPKDLLAVPPVSGPPATYGALPTVKDAAYDRGACAGGSVNEMLSSHGKVWGYTASLRAFSPRETEAIYVLLASYFSCKGLAAGAPAYCDYLPAESGDGRGAVPLAKSPNFKCRTDYLDVAFPGFTAGRGAGDADCRMFYETNFGPGRSNLRTADFCRAAAKGIPNICGGLSQFVDAKDQADCRRVFPTRPRDCGDSPGCFYRTGIYEALKRGEAGACPESYRPQCGAYLSKSTDSCAGLLTALGGAYCEFLAKAQEASGGMAGYSEQDVRDALAQKAELERQAIERRLLDEETKRRARKALGKKD